MSSFNTFTSHPLIPNSNEYSLKKKFISIHSEDRNVNKWPSSSEFEIELPQDYINIQGVRLSTWSFPANYNTFSQDQFNVSLTFQITQAYNPGDYTAHEAFSDLLQEQIFAGLFNNIENNYIINIEEGHYSPSQMAAELTNKMNEVVYNYLYAYIEQYNLDNPTETVDLSTFTEYTGFVVAFNDVNQQLWFGHNSAQFKIITFNDYSNPCSDVDPLIYKKDNNNICKTAHSYPDFTNWGLPSCLGFIRENVDSIVAADLKSLPKFYYGDPLYPNGQWLLPDPELPGAVASYLKAPLKINLTVNTYYYMEVDGMNNLDETIPYSPNRFTRHTNESNGIVNSAFAKIPIPLGKSGQECNDTMDTYMIYQPPAERIRKLKIRIRYHNGALVNFGSLNFSFTLELVIFDAQINKKVNMYVPETVKFGGGHRY
jgi:hypothetical protein